MLPTPPIMLKVPYSSLYLLFGPLKWAQLFTTYLYLIRRPAERIVGALVFVHFSLWWGLHLHVEMISYNVNGHLYPWSSSCGLGLYQKSTQNPSKGRRKIRIGPWWRMVDTLHSISNQKMFSLWALPHQSEHH